MEDEEQPDGWQPDGGQPDEPDGGQPDEADRPDKQQPDAPEPGALGPSALGLYDRDPSEPVFKPKVRKNPLPPARQKQLDDLNKTFRTRGWTPQVFTFTEATGPRNEAASLTHQSTPLDFFSLFLDDTVLEILAVETNRYARISIAYEEAEWARKKIAAEEKGETFTRPKYARSNAWKETSKEELARFLGLWFCSAVVQKPSIECYWSTREAIKTPWFNSVMSRNRFQLLWRYFHFADNNDIDTNVDPLCKVREVCDILIGRFRRFFYPQEDLSIDEGMLAWKGRVKFKVYNPAKPTKYGIKSYMLCESKSGYCVAMKPYDGRSETIDGIVKALLTEELLDKGHTLYMDNYYNSTRLTKYLLNRRTHTVGTLRQGRGAPCVINDLGPTTMKPGQMIVRFNDDAMVLAWQDKKCVRMISTKHKNTMTELEVWMRVQGQGKKRVAASQKQKITKPSCVVDYNFLMNGVDKLDQNISYYPSIRRTLKWTKKFVMYLLQIAMLNAHVIYRHTLRRSPNRRKPKRLLRFLISVFEDMCRPRELPDATDSAPSQSHSTGDELRQKRRPARESGARQRAANSPQDPVCRGDKRLNHKLVKYTWGPRAGAKQKVKRGGPSRKCVACRVFFDQRHETRWYCEVCLTALCKGSCFTDFHSKRYTMALKRLT